LRNVSQVARQLNQTDGAEIAEVALVLPLVFMLLLGAVWFGRAFNIYSTIQQAAQQGAIAAARSTCVTCGNNTSDITVSNTVTSVMQSSNLDPGQIILSSPAPPPCPTPPSGCTTKNNITICRNALLNPTAGNTQAPQCGAIVSFQYPFQFFLPFTSLNMQPITMSAQAQSRMEN
jgi:Flp pilus assembly protein TadG